MEPATSARSPPPRRSRSAARNARSPQLRVFFDEYRQDGAGGMEEAGGFWLDVNVWGVHALEVAQHVKKGARVHVAGRLVEHQWTVTATNEARRALTLNADQLFVSLARVAEIRFRPRRENGAARGVIRIHDGAPSADAEHAMAMEPMAPPTVIRFEYAPPDRTPRRTDRPAATEVSRWLSQPARCPSRIALGVRKIRLPIPARKSAQTGLTSRKPVAARPGGSRQPLHPVRGVPSPSGAGLPIFM